MPNSEWRKQRNGQPLTWQRGMNEIPKRLGAVNANRLPGWRPRGRNTRLVILTPPPFRRYERERVQWSEREFTDRKVRGSNPTFASRCPLSRLGQPGSIPALVPLSGAWQLGTARALQLNDFFRYERITLKVAPPLNTVHLRYTQEVVSLEFRNPPPLLERNVLQLDTIFLIHRASPSSSQTRSAYPKKREEQDDSAHRIRAHQHCRHILSRRWI
ncbi:hypothetical protein CSKR_103983 [Clonorchis sinensis]|uniref:Uncharacterized protein n=1 Tax=Clonorchis sinensis TaxID=79923 RepID=A0A3R7DKL8_CLOSI|nr:hypothetical protein CSKR_103983 [Clonorchis sinensis]